MQILNFSIMKSPINWLTVLLMLLIGGTAFSLVMEHYKAVTSNQG